MCESRVCEECAVDDQDDDSVQLRECGRVLCETCFDLGGDGE